MGSILSWGVHGIHQWTRLSNSTTRASICRYTRPSSREQHMSVWPARRQTQRSKSCEEAGPGAFRRFGGFRAVLEIWEHPMPDTKLGDGGSHVGTVMTWGWFMTTWLYHLNISESYISIEKELYASYTAFANSNSAWKVLPWLKPQRRCCEQPRPIEPIPPARHWNRSTPHLQSTRPRKRRTCVPLLAATVVYTPWCSQPLALYPWWKRMLVISVALSG